MLLCIVIASDNVKYSHLFTQVKMMCPSPKNTKGIFRALALRFWDLITLTTNTIVRKGSIEGWRIVIRKKGGVSLMQMC